MRMTLKAAMDKRRMEPADVARVSGLHLATVYRLMGNQTADPSASTVAALEDALALRRGTLVFGQEAEALAS